MRNFILVCMMLLSFTGCSTLKSFSNENPETTKFVVKTTVKLILEANEDKNLNLVEIESNLKLARLIVSNSENFDASKLKEMLGNRIDDKNVKFVTNLLIDYVNDKANQFKDKTSAMIISIIDGVLYAIRDYQLTHIKT